MMYPLRRCIAVFVLLLAATLCQAQELDSIQPDTLQNTLQKKLDSLTQANKELQDQVIQLELQVERLEEKQKFYEEKEWFYKVEAMRDLRENNIKLTEEKNRYQQLSDSLRLQLNATEKIIVRTNEELKYTQQRAKEAEDKVSNATARKKKVCAIQGIALKTFRTPNWSIAPDKIEDGSIVYRIVNKNGGDVEFDYTAGAYVMLWDLTRETKPVEQTTKPIEQDSTAKKHLEIKKFDQEFSYSLGLYVGFGGSNLFKNFYVGPSFKFLDFFHLTAGVNICEYEMLTGNFQEGDILPPGLSLTDQISKVWKAKPFVSLSFDLDFISYIKK